MTRANILSLLNGELELDCDFVIDNAYCKTGDIVVVSGTLVEGVGNRYSDVDAYVLTQELRSVSEVCLERHHRVISKDRSIIRPGDRDSPVFLIHTVLPDSEVKLDLEYRTFRELGEITRHLHDIYEYAIRNLALLTKVMVEREVTFLHRLFVARAVVNADAFSDVLREIDKDRLCYLLYRWVASDFSHILDIMGAWDKSELDRCVDMARENMLLQMQGYTHLCGHTTARRKWLLNGLERLPPADRGLRERFLSAFLLTGLSGADSKREYVLETLDIVDEIHRLCGTRLAAHGKYPAGEAALRALARDAEFALQDTRYARMEYSYRGLVYGAGSRPTRQYLLAPNSF